MQGINPQTICTPFKAAFAADPAGNNTFTPPVPTLTIPASNSTAAVAIIPLLSTVAANNIADMIGKPVFNSVLLQPFGQGSAGNTFVLNVYGYKPGYTAGNGANGLTNLTLCPVELGTVTCTLGNTAAIANSVYPGGTNDVLCNSAVFSNNTQNNGVDASAIQPLGNNAAWTMIDTKGCPIIGLQASHGNCNNVNVLWAPIS